ncbi:Isochorismatase-like protein [Cladochytrium replicatum]|nr:Isochorismatase-like protein [Cladochytrium replicatum]
MRFPAAWIQVAGLFVLLGELVVATLEFGNLDKYERLYARSGDYGFERLDKNHAVLVILDLQVGLYHLARDWDPTLFRDNMMAHSAIGKIFDIPVVMTTSAQTGPNGPLPKEILDMYPNAPLIKRNGEVDAWDNEEFRAAIRATGRKQIIIAGIVTDVCTTFLALSLRAEGYSVWANIEASGTTSELIRNGANAQMEAAGVQMVSLFSIVCDLMRDWRDIPGAETILPWLDRYMPVYGYVARGHLSAINNGTVIPGQENLGSVIVAAAAQPASEGARGLTSMEIGLASGGGALGVLLAAVGALIYARNSRRKSRLAVTSITQAGWQEVPTAQRPVAEESGVAQVEAEPLN